ncbi:MAG: ribonuclease Z [Syntrophobacteraceae bacterium]|nr:ribonuclease Z [Syntrophobacteraceae bacterium]
MRIKFLGVGEAFDEDLPNTAIQVLVEQAGVEHCILLDCGPTVPTQFWKNCPDADRLDAIWISHFHGDHFFGLPALLAKFRQMNRTKPLLIVSQQGAAQIVTQTIGLAYPSVLSKLGYDLNFVAVEPGEMVKASGLTWRSALNGHSRRDLAVRIEAGGKALFYSGDGAPTAETLALAHGAQLAIHEAFRLDTQVPGHATVWGCIEFARRANVGRLALVHVESSDRRLRRAEILRALATLPDREAFMPEPGDQTSI